jgi:hypothetical protein
MSVDPVAIPVEEYEAMSIHWHLTAALRGGTPAMRAASRIYLPQEPAESETAYKNRIDRSVLTNMYVKTANKLVGKPLKKPIVLEESVPAEIVSLMDDVDALGTSLDVFVRAMFDAAVDDGLTHVLVDMPSVDGVEGDFPDGSLTKEQESDLGIRPYWRHVKAGDLIGWKWQMVKGAKTLTQIRILESAKVPGENEFAQERRNRIRVIEPMMWRLYEEEVNPRKKAENKDWLLIDQGLNTLGRIPLVTFYTNQQGFMVAQPLLMDIAHLNVTHWQSDSDQRNLLHIARVPILFGTGFGDDDDQVQLEIGANTITRAPTGATLGFVEHTGKAIESGAKDLKDLEDRIQFLGMQFLVKRKTGDETATGRSIDKNESDSDLGIITQELENAIEQLLDITAEWLALGRDGGEVSVFRDFEIAFADAEDIKLLLDARKSGEISQLTFFKELKRRGLLGDDFDPQTEIDLLDIEGGGNAQLEPETDGPAQASADISTGDTDPESEDDKSIEGRNAEGDVTAEADEHRHVLEANGKTDTVTDSETGESHFHTWNEFGLRTSVDDGHSHILLSRAGGKSGKSNDDKGQFPEGAQAAGAGVEIGRQEQGGNKPDAA